MLSQVPAGASTQSLVPVWHSSMSAQPVPLSCPSPWYPASQTQRKPPIVLSQVASTGSQSAVPRLHSSMSAQPVPSLSPSPSYPSTQAQV